MNRSIILGLALAGAAPGAANAQLSNVDVSNKFAWGENIGFTNWRDADGGAAGVHVYPTHARGSVWCENVGWIRLGSSPADGVAYTNKDSADYGVNVNPATGELDGFGWGENIGWVNFGGGAQVGPNEAAVVLYEKHRLGGYVWGENVGWISLNDDEIFVGLYCFADYNADGFVTGDDFDAFTIEFELGNSSADVNGDGFVTGDDFDAFTAAFDAGC